MDTAWSEIGTPGNYLASKYGAEKLTLKAGTGITLNVDSSDNSITIRNTSGGGSGVGFTVAATPPAFAVSGDLWLNSNTAILYVYVNDGDSTQWVEFNYAMQGATGNSYPPDAFYFTTLTGQATNTLVYSNTITFTGNSTQVWPLAVRGASAQMSINGESWSTFGNARKDDTLQIRLTTPLSSGQTVVASIYAQGYSTTWTVST
jgi:hypothetical protein